MEWLEGLGIDLTVELDGPSTSSVAALVLVGTNATIDEIAELASSSAAASRRIVFSNGAKWLDHFFPGAMVIGDYASALYHLLRQPSA